jgi:hypothetical protein
VGSAGEDDETLGLQSRVRSRNALQPFTSRLFHHAGAANTPKPQTEVPAFFQLRISFVDTLVYTLVSTLGLEAADASRTDRKVGQ